MFRSFLLSTVATCIITQAGAIKTDTMSANSESDSACSSSSSSSSSLANIHVKRDAEDLKSMLPQPVMDTFVRLSQPGFKDPAGSYLTTDDIKNWKKVFSSVVPHWAKHVDWKAGLVFWAPTDEDLTRDGLTREYYDHFVETSERQLEDAVQEDINNRMEALQSFSWDNLAFAESEMTFRQAALARLFSPFQKQMETGYEVYCNLIKSLIAGGPNQDSFSFYGSYNDKLTVLPPASLWSQFSQLTELHLYGQAITDVSPLRGLKSLRRLHLSQNQITDVRSLGELVDLENLDLMGNKITDASAFEGMKKLKSLNLGCNKVSEIGFLSELANLDWLFLSSNQITDIGPLRGLVNLKTLNLENNKISRLEDLKELVNLQNLNLINNQITSITDLNGLVNLENLYLSNNRIANIQDLQGMVKLKQLLLARNQIIDISPLAGLTKLEQLHLPQNKIFNILALNRMSKLHTLDISDNQVTDLWAVLGCPFDMLVIKNNPLPSASGDPLISRQNEAVLSHFRLRNTVIKR